MKLRSEKVPYEDCPVCPKCGCRGLPYYEKTGFIQYACSICPWRGFWRFWFAIFPAQFAFSVNFGPCGHCKWDLGRTRYSASLNLFGLSLIFNCHSFRDVEGAPEKDEIIVEDELDADVIY